MPGSVRQYNVLLLLVLFLVLVLFWTAVQSIAKEKSRPLPFPPLPPPPPLLHIMDSPLLLQSAIHLLVEAGVNVENDLCSLPSSTSLVKKHFPPCPDNLEYPSESLSWQPASTSSPTAITTPAITTATTTTATTTTAKTRSTSHRELASTTSQTNWTDFMVDLIGTLLCIITAALASGLTIGLLSLDPTVLLIKSKAATKEVDQQQATQLLQVVRQRHLLLVTLLLLNTAAGEALPMFLHGLCGSTEFVTVVVSVVLVLVFGEILPSAVFTGTNQLQIAAACTRIVKCLILIMYPIAYPISKCLDMIVHQDDSENGLMYNRNELAALIRIQYEQRAATKARRFQMVREETRNLAETEHHAHIHQDSLSRSGALDPSLRNLRQQLLRRHSSGIHGDEVNMIQGALQMKTKCAADLVLSHRKVYSISMDTILDEPTMCRIFSSGYSRIPVYEQNNKKRIKGILMTRQLILVNDTDQCPVSRLPLYVPHCIAPDTSLIDVINLFQTGGSATSGRVGHMALVCARPTVAQEALDNDLAIPEAAAWVGIITMEDCLEALLQEQIYDEMDAAGRRVENESLRGLTSSSKARSRSPDSAGFLGLSTGFSPPSSSFDTTPEQVNEDYHPMV